MDSFFSLNSHVKKTEAEEKAYRRETRLRLAVIVISAILLLVIAAGTTVIIIGPDKLGGKSVQNAKSFGSIKLACAATLYPDSCYSSISSARESSSSAEENPGEIFKLSVQVALAAVSRADSFTDSLSDRSGDPAVKAALRDCKELFGSAGDHLNETLVFLQTASASASATQVSEIRTLLSAAVADQATCAEGLMETQAAGEMAGATVNATEYTSNSLAIATNFGKFTNLRRFPTISRKLLAEPDEVPQKTLAFPSRELRRLSEGNFKANLTVAKDGTGDFETISAAIEKAPEMSMVPFVIHVKEGVYEEYVEVGDGKWNVVLLGDGMNKTIVAGSRNRVDGSTAYKTATFTVKGRGFVAMDMTYLNTAGPEKNQAAALLAKADRSIFLRCSFQAFHSTLYLHSLRQFYRDCHIIGAVNFIYGDAAAVFQNCSILPRRPFIGQKSTITAQTRSDPNETTGFSIQNCTISSFGDDAPTPTFLGLPQNKFSRTAVMTSEIGGVVAPEGWSEINPGTAPPVTIFFGEYRNSGPGSGLVGRIRWPGYKPIMTDAEAQQFSAESLIQSSTWINI